MSVETFNPSSLPQSATNWAVASRIVGPFAPHAQAAPNLTIQLDAGHLLNGTALTEVNPQAVGPFAATPSQRVDRVVIDRATGAASIVTGTDGSFTPPAIPAGKLPVARVHLLSTTSAIDNAIIVDERALVDQAPPVPVFVVARAHRNGTNMPLPNGVWTTVPMTATSINVGGAFNTTTGQFKPTIAGNYLISATVRIQAVTDGAALGLGISVNGVLVGTVLFPVGAAGQGAICCTDIVALNGTTDYVEIQAYQGSSGSPTVLGLPGATWFAATLLR